MVRAEAAIFDFDFTLADSSQPITECVLYALNQLGFPAPDPADVVDTIGLSLPETFEHFTSQKDGDLEKRFARVFHARADQIMDSQTRIYECVPPVLYVLRRARMRTGIVTTKLNYRIRNILAVNRLEGFFDAIVGADDVGKTKPDPEGLLLALEQLGTHAEAAVYVGDHIIDAQAARNAGVPFIAALTGRHPRSAFELFPYVAIVESVRDLPCVLSLE